MRNGAEFQKLKKELNTRSRIRVWNAAVEMYQKDDTAVVPLLLQQLKSAKRPFQREAAAWALGSVDAKHAVPVLESVLRTVQNSSAFGVLMH